MSNYAVANRYAVALFQLGKEKGSLTQFANELEVVKEVFKQTPELSSVLAHPKVTKDEKLNMIKTSFASYVSESIIDTLQIIIERNRTDIILPLIDKYKELAYDEQGMAEAKVYSVQPLSDEDKEVISKQFAKKVGKDTLMINNIIDSDLLGGLKIRIGDRIFDGSVRGQIDRMQRHLVGTNR